MTTIPFLTVDEFTESFRPLKPSEDQIAEWLIRVASDWIYARKPQISESDVAAKLVVQEVVSTALRFNKYAPFTSFTEQTSHSTFSGTVSDAAKILDFTDRHRDMLGLPVKSPPQYSFPANDY